jgi:hypothetical protein
MVRTRTIALAAVGGVLAAAAAWSRYQRSTVETVSYTVVGRVGDAELRRYPASVVAETVADGETSAFRRLYRYITGANESAADIPMTAPVAIESADAAAEQSAPPAVTRGRLIPMTAPVETSADADGVRMAFHLPAAYDPDTAPRPTDAEVELRVIPERTLAVRQFSWRPTDDRIERETEALLAALERARIPTAGEPFFMGYDAPWTLPFLRRNEVAVEVDASA